MLVGSIISAILTKDLRWMNWHFSRLGEGGAFSSLIFNLALIISSFLMFTLTYALSRDVLKITDISEHVIQRAHTIVLRSFGLISVCLIGVAVFPFDKYPILHNTFGYLMLVVFLVTCINTRKILPIFSDKFYTYCDNILLFTVVCYSLFVGFKLISLLAVEFAIFTYLYVWLIGFTRGIRGTN